MRPYRAPIFGSLPPVIKNLLIINVLVFMADFVLSNMGFAFTDMFALHNFQSPYFQPIQLVSHMFMHGDLFHIFFNMFALFMFGRMLEVVWGPRRMLLYYFATGLGAAGLYLLVNYIGLRGLKADMLAFVNTPSPELFMSFVREHLSRPSPALNDFIQQYSVNANSPLMEAQAQEYVRQIYELNLNIPMVGASGAVFGVLLAFGMLFPNTQLMLLFPPIPIKAKFLVMIYGAIELFAVIMPRQGDNIAHFAHLGGMIFGFLLIKYWNSKGVSNKMFF
jgi:membrane associated rhomboid family serine protease